MGLDDDKQKAAGAGTVGGAAVGGVAGGAAAGAAAGGMTGPVGAAVGAAVGAGVGALSGKAAADSGTASGGRTTVIGAFDDEAQAQRAVDELAAAGFDRSDVHVERGDSTAGQEVAAGSQEHTKGGGFFSWLFGDDDTYETHRNTYGEAVRRGSSVVVVDVQGDEEAERAASCLHDAGAFDVDERAQQWRSEGWTDRRQTVAADAGMREDVPGGTEERVLDVVQEELQVGKRRLDMGGVRIVQRVSERPVREVVRLREERAVVDRRAVDRPATADDLGTFGEGTLEVRETREEPVVAKTARVVEEVRVGKEVREREETIEDSVRRKDVDVQQVEGSRNTERERAVASDGMRDDVRVNRENERSDMRDGDMTGTPGKDR